MICKFFTHHVNKKVAKNIYPNIFTVHTIVKLYFTIEYLTLFCFYIVN